MNTPTTKTLATAAALTLVLTGCSNNGDTTTTTTSGAATSAATTSTGFPVTVDNCGYEITLDEQPTRVVTLNQGATELALTLGAGDQVVGTAALDDEIDPALKEAYDAIPVLADSETYPSQEKFLSAQPQLAIASYKSAFGEKGVGSRPELHDLGIATFLDPFACKEADKRAEPSWDSIFTVITNVGKLLGQDDNAAKVVEKQQAELADIQQAQPGAGKTIFWYDSGTDKLIVGGNAGGPALIMDAVGATNIHGDINKDWSDASWETVLTANPDYIVFADASWDPAADRIEYLKTNPTTKDLDAVKQERFIVVPFSDTTPGAHLIDGAKVVAEGITQ